MRTSTTFVFEEADIKDLIKTYLGRAGYQLEGQISALEGCSFRAEAVKAKKITRKDKEAANPTPSLPFQSGPSTAETAPPARPIPKPKPSTTS